MISSIRGTALKVGVDSVVIDISGVGFRCEVPRSTAAQARVGSELALHTELVVREDSLTVFGFADEDDLALFKLLISVTGVGPRSALGILSELPLQQIVSAIQSDDDAPFRRVSGIGPKTAKLIVVSLAGKVDALQHASFEAEATGAGDSEAELQLSIRADVVQALIGLGWKEQSASDAVADAVRAGAEPNESALLRAALLLLQNAPGRS